MNGSSFFTRILWAGAVGATLLSGLFICVIASSMIGRGNDWLSWLNVILMTLGVVALNAVVWFRLLRRRAAHRSSKGSGPNPFTPRSKYAVWSRVPRPSPVNSANTAKKTKSLTNKNRRV